MSNNPSRAENETKTFRKWNSMRTVYIWVPVIVAFKIAKENAQTYFWVRSSPVAIVDMGERALKENSKYSWTYILRFFDCQFFKKWTCKII